MIPPYIPVIVGADFTVTGVRKRQRIYIPDSTPCRDLLEYARDVLGADDDPDDLVLVRHGSVIEADAVISLPWEGETLLLSRRSG